jgi:hypothetical protein
MTRFRLIYGFLFISTFAFSQTDLKIGYIITNNNDTIRGYLQNQDYFKTRRIRISSNKLTNTYPKSSIKEIQVGDISYVKSEISEWGKVFFRKEISGYLNLYLYKKRKYLGKYDSDINLANLRPSITLYCDDFPDLTNKINEINKKNIETFVKEYNNWKSINPESKSYYDKFIHNKNLIALKMSFLLPGAGIELKINNYFSIQSMLKFEFGYSSMESWIFNPLLDSQLRYYYDFENRLNNNKRTYKYTGNYVCLVNGLSPKQNTNFIGFEHGWQRTFGKHYYSNLGLGVAKNLSGKEFYILTDYDFGFNF